jgi:glycine/sarcosine/betaine reductase complex component C subunit beta
MDPVVLGARFFLAHTPGLVRYGSKPSREIGRDPAVLAQISSRLRSWDEAAAYAPNQVFLGGMEPEGLAALPRPWFASPRPVARRHPHGEIMPETEFYALLRLADQFDLVRLEESFAREAAAALAADPDVRPEEPAAAAGGEAPASIESDVAGKDGALGLYLKSGRLVGSIRRGHEDDTVLTADVLLENLACKVTAAMAARALMREAGVDPASIDYVINSGEEAVGDRYQRGGGNLAKAIAEMCGCAGATGSDVKAFCCGPAHALVIAAAMVKAGLYRRVLVVGGCSLAKLGMKFRGHVARDYPIVEDVLAGAAVLVGPDDGRSPVIRLDSVGRHPVGAGGSQQQILEALVEAPLRRLGLRFADVDRYATELHNPEATEPSGSGNVPLLNYRLIAALAVRARELERAGLDAFVARHGLPGFSPTQGHIASALPFIAHAHDRLVGGRMRRAMFLAKGSLFLGRMTQMSDGLAFILERNPAANRV